jgi:hypothetical protein
MKKNLIIAGLAIGLAMAIVFGIYQRTEARRQEALAVANAVEATIHRDNAEMARKEAEEQRKMAIMNAMEAERQRQVADEALKNCLKKK